MTDLRKVAQQALEALDCLEAPPTGAINHYELERRKNALRAALAEPVGVVRQFRKMRCADWYDGLPDHEDGGGPYETRTLYTHPPARVPLSDDRIRAAIDAWFEYDIVAGQRSFAKRMRSAIEAALGIGGGK